ncbi:ornithine--oxo-acid transaminase [Ruania alkalisoli]|uniref:ornithine aminotransferase n=1 Tax=Ruania alkalisoli TaxID=2779775 RepID=A0A7M1SVH5_9MICO|nr:ornithine--oxo-acid transaminase [Ruania alkalisoli]QOR71525.1 ornithine--oxo-acid transaminase [Ruania alkalisoli]
MTTLAPNYHPLDIEIAHAEGAWVTDTAGIRYLDCLAGYSALNFGHRHPALVAAAHAQLDRLTLTSRAVRHELLEPFAQAVTSLTGTEMLLPMNTGAEAVETAIKAARKWGYDVRSVPSDSATIVVAEGAFHGRTTTIVSMSSDAEARTGFGPYTPGFRIVPYGDAGALAAAIDETTVAVLLEPVQGEAGVIVPPEGYLAAVRETCNAQDVLLILDEIQSGLGRTGAILTQDLAGIRADLTTLGKALGGGIVPVSAVVGRADVLRGLTPGTHGSTFGGNPLACAVGLAVAELLRSGLFQKRVAALAPVLAARADQLLRSGHVRAVRQIGLWLGVDVLARTGREVSERMAANGVIAKETHDHTIRLAPPLCVTEEELHLMMDALARAVAP